MTTLELKKLNQRLKSSFEEVLILSDSIIEDLRAAIVEHIACVYKASEAVAILDLVVLFAEHASTYNYVRPEFCSSMVIKAGRHPILDRSKAIPNDVYVSDSSRFTIITGPNMSGKTTYLKSIGLLMVMALVGSYVPAEYASFDAPDALLACLTVGENIEQNLSAFAAEMQTCAAMLSQASRKSVILIDELGRGTSHHEGFGIVYAIAEELIVRRSTTFFATHYSELPAILDAQPSVVLKYLQVGLTKDGKRSTFNFKHKIALGQAKNEHIGLDLAEMVGMGKDLVARARGHSRHLAELCRRDEGDAERKMMIKRRKEIYRIVAQLRQILDTSLLSEKELGEQLLKLQAATINNLHQTFVSQEVKQA